LSDSTPLPDDFSQHSIVCYSELDEGASVPVFALPNTCTMDEWGVTFAFPTGWVIDETQGPCGLYDSVTDPQAPYFPIEAGVATAGENPFQESWWGDQYIPDGVYSVNGRRFKIWVWEWENGGGGLTYTTSLWPEYPEGPVVFITADTRANQHADSIAQMMLALLETAPFTS